jgi:TetR/AcrR family transcriptional repressor of nem operon
MSPAVAHAAKQDTKTLLLDAGMNIMLTKGYNNTGISEVLSSVGVPKGSFYHFFESKEAFALAIIARVDDVYMAKTRELFADESLTPLTKLKTYCETNRQALAANECRKGCLIGNLSQEMADQSEVLRAALVASMNSGRTAFATIIEAGQKQGEIKNMRSSHELAELFQSAWHGSMLRAKTTKTLEPIDNFINLFFSDVLQAQA